MPRWRLTIACTAAAAVVGLAGFGLGLAVAGPHGSTAGQWLLDFSKTPGAAAVAALAAASIAFTGITRQVKASHAQLDHQRSSEANARWWESFEWAATRAIPPGESDVALPIETSISTLTALRDDATSDIQLTSCRGLIDELSRRLGESSRDAEAVESEPDTNETSAAWAALSNWVATAAAGPANSPAAEARLREFELLQALSLAAQLHPETIDRVEADRVLSKGDGRLFRPDAIATVEGVEIVVEIASGVNVARRARDVRQRLAGTELENAPILMITETSVSSQNPLSRTPTHILHWTRGDDLLPLVTELQILARASRS